MILTTDFLGAGVAIAFIHKNQHIYGLLSYLFPYREEDIQLDDAWIYSGETLLDQFQEELLSLKINIEEAKWCLVGGSFFKENPPFLSLPEKNLKLAETWLRKNGLWEKTIKKVRTNFPLILRVNGKEEKFELKIKNKKVECYE